MPTLQVFDPSMCCSTGICGPEVDERLVRFAADLGWLESKGITVTRTNLSQEPTAFVADPEAKSVLEERGEAGLPLIKVDGKVVSSGVFPSREELAAWVKVSPPVLRVVQPASESEGCCAPAGNDEQPKKTSCC